MRFHIATVLAGLFLAACAAGCGGPSTTESKTTRPDAPVGVRGGTTGKQVPTPPPVPKQ